MGVYKQKPQYLIGRDTQPERTPYRIARYMEKYHVGQPPVRLHVAE
jgi:hypothetical protein